MQLTVQPTIKKRERNRRKDLIESTNFRYLEKHYFVGTKQEV